MGRQSSGSSSSRGPITPRMSPLSSSVKGPTGSRPPQRTGASKFSRRPSRCSREDVHVLLCYSFCYFLSFLRGARHDISAGRRSLSLSLCLFILSVFDGRELHLQFPVL